MIILRQSSSFCKSHVDSINHFIGNLQTLITKTMEDTSMTIKAFETSRIEYDAYRSDYEHILSINHTGGAKLSQKEKQIEGQYNHFKNIYEKYKIDVTVKLRLIDDHRVGRILCFVKKGV